MKKNKIYKATLIIVLTAIMIYSCGENSNDIQSLGY